MIGRFSGRWKANTEHRKIAMHQSRAIAAAYSLLHMIPLAAAITLLSFQFAKAWVGYANDYSTALQFAAKFHELVMQASLVEVLLCLIRTGMVDSLVPLGALSGAIQATQLSYLWSLDFFSIFTSRALEGWRRVIFLVAVPTLITLISVVDPSSAVLMIPRPNSPRVLPSVLDHVNASRGALYPSYFNLADVPNTDFSRISNNRMHASIYGGILSEASSNDRRENAVIYRDADGTVSLDRVLRHWEGNPTSRATIPTKFTEKRLRTVEDYIYRLPGYHMLRMKNATIKVVAPHPVCKFKSPSTSVRMNTTLPYWTDDWQSIGKLPELRTLLKNLSFVEPTYSSELRRFVFSPIYVPSPEPDSHSSIVILMDGILDARLNTSTTDLLPWMIAQLDLDRPRMVFQATICTISAYWNSGEIQMITNGLSALAKKDASSLSVQSDPQSITPSFAGADAWSSPTFAKNAPADLEVYLATNLAIVLSQIPTHDSFAFFPLGSTGFSQPTTFEFTITEYGFGYGTRSTSVYLAIAVILLYCIIVAGYIVYTLVTGSASTAWNSGIELFTLALQSSKPDHLGHTSVGLDSIKTFSEGVGVRVNAHNELEIVFANDRDLETKGLRKLVRNKEY